MSARARTVAYSALALTALACLLGVYAYFAAPRQDCVWEKTDIGTLIVCPGLKGGVFFPDSGFLDSEFGQGGRYKRLYVSAKPRGFMISWSLWPTCGRPPILSFGFPGEYPGAEDQVVVASIYSRESGHLVDLELDLSAHTARVTDRQFLDPARMREVGNGSLVVARPPM